MWICPECRTIYRKPQPRCDRDDAPLAEVQAHQVKSRYPLLGKVVGDRYHLIGGLGQGGLGTVYLAQHLHLEHLFAVKFLDLETVGLDVDKNQKDEYGRDFMKEARVASLIRHDSVVRVSDFGIYEKMPFLVMDYVPGPSLLQMLAERGRFEVPEAINIARRIASALGAFHERRLVHRDLKPANVILDPRGDGRLTLVDLGLVKDVSGHGGKASTHPMALRGTPGYLAPEQVPSWVLSGIGAHSGEKRLVDARVDLYALGVLFYEMIAGVSPYPDGSNTQIIIWACTKDPLPLDGVEPPVKMIPGLEQLIYDTMARDPERRPESAQAFIDRLDDIAMGPAIKGSWPAMIVPGVRKRRRSKSPKAPRPGAALAALIPEVGDGGDLPADTELMSPDKAAAAVQQAARSTGSYGEGSSQVGGSTFDDDLDGLGSIGGIGDSSLDVPTAVEGYVDDSMDMAPTQVEPLSGANQAMLIATRISRVDLDEEEPTKADLSPPVMLTGPGFTLGQVSPQPEPKADYRRLAKLLALPLVAIVTALIVWAISSGDGPAPPPEDAAAEGVIKIGGGGDDPARPPPTVVVTPVVNDAATPPPVPDAEVVAERAAEDTPRRKPKRRAPKRQQPPKRLIAEGDKALRAGNTGKAIRYYERFLDRVGPDHPQYRVIENRLNSLKD